jgi:hypothetical protein
VSSEGHSEAGNTLLLFPAAVLVLVVLGALAVDLGVAHLAQRDLANLSAGVANDIAGALEEEGFYVEGEARIDPERAARILAAAVAAHPGEAVTITDADWELLGGAEVIVRLEGEVPVVFTGAVTRDGVRRVRAESRATAIER